MVTMQELVLVDGAVNLRLKVSESGGIADFEQKYKGEMRLILAQMEAAAGLVRRGQQDEANTCMDMATATFNDLKNWLARDPLFEFCKTLG